MCRKYIGHLVRCGPTCLLIRSVLGQDWQIKCGLLLAQYWDTTAPALAFHDWLYIGVAMTNHYITRTDPDVTSPNEAEDMPYSITGSLHEFAMNYICLTLIGLNYQ